MFSPFPFPASLRASLLVIALLLALAAATTLSAPHALANGGSDTRTIFEERVEGYGVVVTSTPGRPTEGLVHLTFSLSDASTQEVVTGATLTLSVTPPGESGLDATSFDVDRSEVNPDLYDVNVDMEAEGVWFLALSIDGPQGPAEAGFPLEVRGPASKIFAILIVVLAFPLLLALLEGWRRWDRRKKRAQQNDASSVITADSTEKRGHC